MLGHREITRFTYALFGLGTKVLGLGEIVRLTSAVLGGWIDFIEVEKNDRECVGARILLSRG